MMINKTKAVLAACAFLALSNPVQAGWLQRLAGVACVLTVSKDIIYDSYTMYKFKQKSNQKMAEYDAKHQKMMTEARGNIHATWPLIEARTFRNLEKMSEHCINNNNGQKCLDSYEDFMEFLSQFSTEEQIVIMRRLEENASFIKQAERLDAFFKSPEADSIRSKMDTLTEKYAL